jgi:hypothetical protein
MDLDCSIDLKAMLFEFCCPFCAMQALVGCEIATELRDHQQSSSDRCDAHDTRGH